MQENLWAPWRMEYINSLDAEPCDDKAPPAKKGPTCFICEAAKVAPDSPAAEKLLVLHRDERGLIMLNRYPYTSGHLLVALDEHLGELSDLSPLQRAGLMELTAMSERLLRLAVNPQGINVGINLGRCAGAGLPGHLHVHLVPRWSGDVNFMSAVGQVRVIPQALEATWAHLRATLEKIEHEDTKTRRKTMRNPE